MQKAPRYGEIGDGPVPNKDAGAFASLNVPQAAGLVGGSRGEVVAVGVKFDHLGGKEEGKSPRRVAKTWL